VLATLLPCAFAELKNEIANLTVIVKYQPTQIQKVTAQLEVIVSTPQIVMNNELN
jgi:hypothetical protein